MEEEFKILLPSQGIVVHKGVGYTGEVSYSARFDVESRPIRIPMYTFDRPPMATNEPTQPKTISIPLYTYTADSANVAVAILMSNYVIDFISAVEDLDTQKNPLDNDRKIR
ncbi:hypothetical protein KKF61_08995 [Patescibacteria group bacterium]|nr:hypothetical protein [Patescibacteria group bacterium]